MKCLTVRQFWVWAIIAGHKRVENRTWNTTHRGPLLIHAGMNLAEDSQIVLERAGLVVPDEVPVGVILGVVDVVDVVCWPAQADEYDLAEDPLATGPYCWILRNPRAFSPPIPQRGAQGLFDVSLPAGLL